MERYGPKTKDHPSIGELCPACKKQFIEGDYTTLITLGPGDNPEEQQKAKLGKLYTAVAIEVHFSCIDTKVIKEAEHFNRSIYNLTAKIKQLEEFTGIYQGDWTEQHEIEFRADILKAAKCKAKALNVSLSHVGDLIKELLQKEFIIIR